LNIALYTTCFRHDFLLGGGKASCGEVEKICGGGEASGTEQM
jgi:hypothetical protein